MLFHAFGLQNASSSGRIFGNEKVHERLKIKAENGLKL